MSRTKQKVVLITGAGGGMCTGINARLAKAGYALALVDLSAEAVERAVQAVTAAGGDAKPFAADVTDPAQVHALGEQVRAEFGAVDAIVNAAGVLDRKYLKDHDDDSFARVLGINLVGPFRIIQEFAPAMVEQGWGRIVNISSIAGVTGYPYPSYAASKAGLSNLTRSLTIDFWGTGVTINSICPGVVDTPMVIDEVRRQVPRKVPTERIVEPDEIGAVAAFLLSDDARSINGADILIDGGATRFFQLFDRP